MVECLPLIKTKVGVSSVYGGTLPLIKTKVGVSSLYGGTLPLIKTKVGYLVYMVERSL